MSPFHVTSSFFQVFWYKVQIWWEGQKIWKNLPPVLTKQLFLLSSVKTSGRFFQIFVASLEKLNFTNVIWLRMPNTEKKFAPKFSRQITTNFKKMYFYFSGMNRPCIEGATCHQDGVKNFKCECDHGQVCTKDGHASIPGSGSGVRPLVRNLYVKLVR